VTAKKQKKINKLNKPSFEEQLDIIQHEILKRKSKWTLVAIPFEDVSQMVIIRIFKKYHLFEPEKGEFSHWVNKVISSAIKNILRDNYLKYNRPCLGCAKNLGGDTCSYTPSGKQCEECPLYVRWKKSKEQHFNVKQSLSLENHAQEAESKVGDFTNISDAKEKIDEKIKKKLKPIEFKLYTLLYVENLSEREAGLKMEYRQTNKDRGPGYQQIAKMKAKILKAAKEVIEEEDLA